MQLADTSAWHIAKRAGQAGQEFNARVREGLVGTCPMVMFELFASARSGADFDRMQEELDVLRLYQVGQSQWRRALDVYRELAHQGGAHQRSVGHEDLLIAAAAESAGVELLHYDEDFERIAAITGQPTRWIAPRGSL
ncbi:MAG: PIN domain nuclease [Solirubrobacteraceae bacterium]